MNLDKLREQDDDVLRVCDTWPRSKLLRLFQVLKIRGMSSDGIDHQIIYEFKRENSDS
jgi:hypothetical protein